MAPRNPNLQPRRNRRRRNGNGVTQGRVTKRQNFNTRSNGLSSRGGVRRPLINKAFIEAGSDFLGAVTVKASPQTAGDRIIHKGAVSPSAFAGTRLTQLSNLWERYRFRKFRLRWVPAVPKTLACQLIVYQDTDPLDDPATITDADALVRQATAQTGSQQFNFINAKAIDLAKRKDDQLYYTGPLKENQRFSRQGNFFVVQVTDPVTMNGEAIKDDLMSGSLYVDWVCEFQVAQINPTAVEAALPAPDCPHMVTSQVWIDPTYFPNGEEVTVGTLNVFSPITISASLVEFPIANRDWSLELKMGSNETLHLKNDLSGNQSFKQGNPLIPLEPGEYTVVGTGRDGDSGDITTTIFHFSYTMLSNGVPPIFI